MFYGDALYAPCAVSRQVFFPFTPQVGLTPQWPGAFPRTFSPVESQQREGTPQKSFSPPGLGLNYDRLPSKLVMPEIGPFLVHVPGRSLPLSSKTRQVLLGPAQLFSLGIRLPSSKFQPPTPRHWWWISCPPRSRSSLTPLVSPPVRAGPVPESRKRRE